MPQKFAKSSPQLAIILEQPLDKQPHRPGDTITGRVYRAAPGVAPEARVSVTIYGRTKSKLTVKRGQSTSYYRTSINTLSAPIENQVLFSGSALHIPQGSAGEAWPFAIQIPPFVRDIRDAWQQKYFWSPGGSLQTPFPPPGTLHFSGDSFLSGKTCNAFTEYYVHAKIELLHQHKGRTVSDSHTAIAPFPLRNVHPGPPITDFNMKLCRQNHTASAYKLVPGVGDLSFGQKTRQLFSSSKVPKLVLSITLSLPQTLQVGNKGTIPITLRINTVTPPTSEVIHDIPQDIMITSFSLRVKPHTLVRAERHSFDKSSPEVRLVPVVPIQALASGEGQRLCITVTPGSGEAQPEPLRLGEMLGIRVPDPGPYPTSNLQPDLLTYNILRTHKLVWEMTASVAGEHLQMGGLQGVRVLPGPGDGELPGYSKGNEALPSYGDAVNAS